MHPRKMAMQTFCSFSSLGIFDLSVFALEGRNRLQFIVIAETIPLSRSISTHCLNCASRRRHCPPTLNAGSSPLRIILCSVRVETCRRFAASERVSKQMFSNFLSIEKFLRRAKRNADASKNLHLTRCFRKRRPTMTGASRVQKWTSRDKPRLTSAAEDHCGKDYLENAAT